MQTGEDILFTAPGPDPIPTATTEIVGTPGNGFNVYWIVSHFPIGSVVSGPFPQKDSPNLLDFENYVHISWLPTPGASSYDLLFTKELRLPRQPGRFLLAAGLTDTEFRDTGQGLDFYDVAGIPLGAPQEEHIYFDNRDRKQPTLRFIPWPIEVSSIIFEDGSEQNTAGGGAAAAPPNQSVQFNNNAAFAGSQNLTWDGTGLTIGGNATITRNYFVSNEPFSIFGFDGIEIQTIASPLVLTAFDRCRIDASEFITLETAGSERIRITSTGNVGIGTSNPQATLDVAVPSLFDPSLTPGSPASFIILSSNFYMAELAIGNSSLAPSYPYWLQARSTNGAQALVFNPLGGNVGIGTGNPTSALHVVGDIFAAGNNIYVQNPANTTANLVTQTDSEIWIIRNSGSGTGLPGVFSIVQNSSGDFVFNIDTQGRVGIGTFSPQATLDTGTNLAAIKIATFGDPLGSYGIGTQIIAGPNQGAVTFGANIDPINGVPQMVLLSDGVLLLRPLNSAAGPALSMAFDIAGHGSINTFGTGDVLSPLFIDGNPLLLNRVPGNNVGIGTQNPQFALDVNGDINLTGVIRINGVQVFP